MCIRDSYERSVIIDVAMPHIERTKHLFLHERGERLPTDLLHDPGEQHVVDIAI